MKVTRYFQSCLLIEEGEVRILIDPSGGEKERLTGFGKLDAVLYTHEHSDHFDAMANEFASGGTPVYANASTAKQMKSQPNVITDGQEFSVGTLKLITMELPHCLMPNGNPGPQNVGYLLAGKFFHPGDGVELASLKVENLALPITGPDVSFKDAFSFAAKAGSKKVIPIHYDYIGTKPDVFQSLTGNFDPPFEVHVLGLGESVEL